MYNNYHINFLVENIYLALQLINFFMKKITLLLITVFTVNFAFSQFYISASGGYTIPSAGVKFGETITSTTSESNYGSYGEGSNGQLRFGYSINDTFGVELGFGYLHGADQTIDKVNLPDQEVDIKARGRAFGVLPQLTYRFDNHFYGRIGALLKVGGKTEALIYNKSTLDNDSATALGLPSGAYTVVDATIAYHGQLPLGVVAAMGYKVSLGGNWSLFTEFEYMGVSVKRKNSEIAAMAGGVFLSNGTQIMPFDMNNLPTGWEAQTEYVDELPTSMLQANGGSTFPAKKLSEKVPYSSFGINFGITYTFSKKNIE